MKAIGLVGTNGAGKSTLCDYLGKKGYHVFSLSDVVRHYIKDQGGDLSRDSMTDTANELKATYGLTYFAEASFKKAQDQQCDCVVFDSVRNVQEVTFLKERGVVFIGVDASLDVRYQRIKERKRETDFVDFETFKRQDERELSGQSSGQNISLALKECSVIIDNNADYDQFVSRIEKALSEMAFTCHD